MREYFYVKTWQSGRRHSRVRAAIQTVSLLRRLGIIQLQHVKEVDVHRTVVKTEGKWVKGNLGRRFVNFDEDFIETSYNFLNTFSFFWPHGTSLKQSCHINTPTSAINSHYIVCYHWLRVVSRASNTVVLMIYVWII